MIKVLTIGTATNDFFIKVKGGIEMQDKNQFPKNQFPKHKAQCLPLGEKIEIEDLAEKVGGGATNSAITFSRQGFNTSCLIEVGIDEGAEIIKKKLIKEKVSVIAKKEKNKSTASSIILVAPSGERTILVHRGVSQDLDIKLSDLPKADLAYIAPGNIPPQQILKILSELHKNKTIVAFNPSKLYVEMGVKKLSAFFSKCALVILNREEASLLTGIVYEKEKEIFEKFDSIVPGFVIMTDGSRGVMVSDNNNFYRASIFKENYVVDKTGAGDAFGSGFTAGLLQKLGTALLQADETKKEEAIKYAIRLGSANATSVVESLGAQDGILKKLEFIKTKRFRDLPIFKTKI